MDDLLVTDESEEERKRTEAGKPPPVKSAVVAAAVKRPLSIAAPAPAFKNGQLDREQLQRRKERERERQQREKEKRREKAKPYSRTELRKELETGEKDRIKNLVQKLKEENKGKSSLLAGMGRIPKLPKKEPPPVAVVNSFEAALGSMDSKPPAVAKAPPLAKNKNRDLLESLAAGPAKPASKSSLEKKIIEREAAHKRLKEEPEVKSESEEDVDQPEAIMEAVPQDETEDLGGGTESVEEDQSLKKEEDVKEEKEEESSSSSSSSEEDQKDEEEEKKYNGQGERRSSDSSVSSLEVEASQKKDKDSQETTTTAAIPSAKSDMDSKVKSSSHKKEKSDSRSDKKSSSSSSSSRRHRHHSESEKSKEKKSESARDSKSAAKKEERRPSTDSSSSKPTRPTLSIDKAATDSKRPAAESPKVKKSPSVIKESSIFGDVLSSIMKDDQPRKKKRRLSDIKAEKEAKVTRKAE